MPLFGRKSDDVSTHRTRSRSIFSHTSEHQYFQSCGRSPDFRCSTSTSRNAACNQFGLSGPKRKAPEYQPTRRCIRSKARGRSRHLTGWCTFGWACARPSGAAEATRRGSDGDRGGENAFQGPGEGLGQGTSWDRKSTLPDTHRAFNN